MQTAVFSPARVAIICMVLSAFFSSLFSIPARAADGSVHTVPEKVPGIMVHGATGSDCSETVWLEVDSASVDLASRDVLLNSEDQETDAGCVAKYYALSKDRAVQAGIINAPLDQTYPLMQPFVVGVKFHVLSVAPLADSYDCFGSLAFSSVGSEEDCVNLMIDEYVAAAHWIFENRGVGILVGMNNHISEEVDKDGLQEAIDLVPEVLIGSETPSALLQALKDLSRDSYAKGLINVYLFKGSEVGGSPPQMAQFRAFYSGEGPNSFDDFIMINWEFANFQSFAHELGHAFSLRHVNWIDPYGNMWCRVYNGYDGVCDYNSFNLMWIQGTERRDYLTPPQSLRAALNQRSFINSERRIGRQPDVTVDCPDNAVSSECPFLGALHE